MCVTDALTTVQSSVGTLSENNLMTVVTNLIGGNVNSSILPQSLICSACTQAAVTVLNTNVPGLLGSDVDSYFSSTCGSSFSTSSNSSLPSSVSETAKGSSFASSSGNSASGALSTFPVASLVVSLSSLASAFVLLA